MIGKLSFLLFVAFLLFNYATPDTKVALVISLMIYLTALVLLGLTVL